MVDPNVDPENANGDQRNVGARNNEKSIQLKSFPNFDLTDDFIIFKERLENVFDVMKTEENKKPGILIAQLGTEVYKILKNLCNPVVPKTKTYDQLITLLSGNFVPKILIFKERKKFYDAKQLQGESITEWHLRINTLAIDCDFGANLNTILMDRFICGLLKGKVFDRICEEEITVSYEQILKIALSKELIEKDESSIHKISNFKTKKSNQKKQSGVSSNENSNKTVCFACGKPDHNFSQCKFKKLRCNICNLVGHISNVCKKKNIH